MGLSSMSDETGHTSRTVDALYGHRFYLTPTKHEWETWYAWYPVPIFEWRILGFNDVSFKVRRWVWFERIMRRRIVDRGLSGLAGVIGAKGYTEYTSIEEFLKHG